MGMLGRKSVLPSTLTMKFAHLGPVGVWFSLVSGCVTCLWSVGVLWTTSCACVGVTGMRHDLGNGFSCDLCENIFSVHVSWSLRFTPCLSPANVRRPKEWCGCAEWPVPDTVQRVSPSSKYATYMLLLQWCQLLCLPRLGDKRQRNPGKTASPFFSSLVHSTGTVPT